MSVSLLRRGALSKSRFRTDAFSDCSSAGDECGGIVEHSLAAFTRLSLRLLDRAFYARVRAARIQKPVSTGLTPDGFSHAKAADPKARWKRAVGRPPQLNPALKALVC